MKPRDRFVRFEAGSDRVPLVSVAELTRQPVYGVLDRIRSAHNVGSMFRTADGGCLQQLLLCGYTPTPPHRHLAKTALGAVDAVPWLHFPLVTEALDWLREQHVWIVGLEKTEASQCLWDVPLQFPLALVVGNEVEGLAPDVLGACNVVAHLPMMGHKNSLNVSVAFGAAVYHVLEQRYAQRL